MITEEENISSDVCPARLASDKTSIAIRSKTSWI
jgi:hypothetical protein